jgi:hypothetical protein
MLGAIALGVLVVHGWWLPRHGVNGWTAEPRDRYNALMRLDATGKPLGGAGQTEGTLVIAKIQVCRALASHALLTLL